MVLATGAASIAALTGCTALDGGSGDRTTLQRVVTRSETGQTERVELTLVYAPRDSSAQQPVRGVHELPASDDTVVIDDFEGTPGFYSLTVSVENSVVDGVIAFNSYGPAVTGNAVQFEVLIDGQGNLHLNIGEAGSPISMP